MRVIQLERFAGGPERKVVPEILDEFSDADASAALLHQVERLLLESAIDLWIGCVEGPEAPLQFRCLFRDRREQRQVRGAGLLAHKTLARCRTICTIGAPSR